MMEMTIRIAGEDFDCEYVEKLPMLDIVEPFITFDTETTGLHIKKDVPFLGGVCVGHAVYIFPASSYNFSMLVQWSEQVKRVYGHNVPFDMHMVANYMLDDRFPLHIKNWGDSMCLCRLVFEAVSARDGGDKLGLKEVSAKYIDSTSNRYEAAVKGWLQAKEAADKKILTAVLHGFRDENNRRWTVKRLVSAIEDGTEWVPKEVMDAYQLWRQEYPKPGYDAVPLELMFPYLAVDVILTRLLVLKCLPIIKRREQISTMEREFRVLPVVYKMECAGIAVDMDYLEDSSKRLADYIDDQYTKLHTAVGFQFSVYQNNVIKKIFTDLLGKEPSSTDKKALGKIMAKGGQAGEVAEYINRIRRLEKWKSVYVDRILENARKAGDSRAYTQMSQFNPVSGRFSGDFQQFPKDPIYTEEGYDWEKEHKGHTVPDEHILFHPRRAFVGHMYYLDYSQVELRVQAHYTLYFGGDTNLCRAYMPYKCTHYKERSGFDYTTQDGRNRWAELREGHPDPRTFRDGMEGLLKAGWSVWVTEDGRPWIPTDVHSATTEKALRAMGFSLDTMSDDDFKWWRKKGKTFNFMRNYGGGDAKAAETLDISLEAAKAMNRGYSEAFPMVVTYQENVIKSMRLKGYAVNMFGRRYYLSDWNKHYKVGNYLIQGSCADLLKEKMVLVDQFIESNGLADKLTMILCVHDELQFQNLTGENLDWAIAKIKAIMEDTPNISVPIVAEAEVTKTDWASKKELHLVA